MQARHTQDDHARLPADRPGEGSEPVEGDERPAASGAVAIADEEPRGGADAGAWPAPPSRHRTTVTGTVPEADSRDTKDPSPPLWRRRVLENLDLVFLLPAVLLALALGAPAFGVLVGAGGWLLQRAAEVADRRLIVRSAEPGSRLGLYFIDAFARIWLLAGAIVLAGVVGGHPDGLAAALLILATYSIAFAVRVARGREGGPA
jgi:hypothetical protein